MRLLRITPEQQELLDSVDETDVSAMINAICKIARNKRLDEMIQGLHDLIRASASIRREQTGRAHQAIEEHREIVEAVKNKDG